MNSVAPGIPVSSESRPVVDVTGTFSSESLKRLLVPLCLGDQWIFRHIELSWAGDGPPFWRHALPSVTGSLGAWPRCW